MVSEVTTGFVEAASLKKVYINCMSIKTSKDLYSNLIDYLCDDLEVMEGEEMTTLHSMFVPRKKGQTAYVVTLDEIDHILTLDMEILYRLFEWSLQASSSLILVGIANALDLTDRFLPRLKARNLKPQLLPFLPYTAAGIKNVIVSRLKSLVPTDSSTPDCIPFLHPAAIELCSRKVASQTGDLRKAFDICRRAIDMIEAETKAKYDQALSEDGEAPTPSKRPLEEISNSALAPAKTETSLAQKLSSLSVETAPRALITHLNKITSTTLSVGNSSRLKTLNLQQKAALCALVALEKNKRNAVANLIPSTPSKSRVEAPTVKQLYSVYCMLCKKDSILHPLTSTEFRDVVGSLETMGLVSGVDARGTAGKRAKKFGGSVGTGDERRVASCAGEKEVAVSVEGLGAGILKSILSGEGLD
jgi:cell division control protein 6